ISGARVGRFLDAPDKDTRAVLLYGPNESFVHEAAQRLTRFAIGASDDPYALTKLAEDDIKKDVARLGDALAAQSLLGGPTVVWARISGRSADASIEAAIEAIETGEPSGFLVVEAGDLPSSSALVKAFASGKRAAVIAFYEESEAERAQF